MRGSETIEAAEVIGTDGDALPPIRRLVRHSNNGWTGYFALNAEVVLPDGRRVVFRRDVAVRATQQLGRKRPAMA